MPRRSANEMSFLSLPKRTGEDVVARIVIARARLVVEGSTVDELLVGDPMGLVSVTSRYRFRAAGLSMVVMPERKMSACLSFVKGLALLVKVLKWWIIVASTSLCD